VEKQITILAGDLFAANFENNRFDIALLGNITHFLSKEENLHLFRKVFATLMKGVIIALNCHRKESSGQEVADCWFYAVSKSGTSYSFAEYQKLLEQAGFSRVEEMSIRPIKAIKP